MRVLLTGGSGRLGTELRQLLPDVVAPVRTEMNVTDPESVRRAVGRHEPDVIVHAAAYTDVSGAEANREACWTTNVRGTRSVTGAAAEAKVLLVHISTDYVFDGTRGQYREEDPLGPALNYYALTKIVAEEVARTAPRHLVLRTSFRPREWAYPKAFTDIYTSQDYVDVIAPLIALAIEHAAAIPFDTLHIATERKSVYDLARRRAPDVQPGTKQEASVRLPDDISLDISRWQTLRPQLTA